MSRIFRYILKHDNGMAPCIDAGLLSLATCKPKIRGSAEPGDWVLGFYPRPSPRGLVAWAGRVDRCVAIGDYETQFLGRSDAVYRLLRNGGYKRLLAGFHSSEKAFRKDISAPVLVFDRSATWYFGSCPRPLPAHLEHLAAAGQGHRVNGVLEGDLASMTAWLAALPAPGIHGPPRDPPLPKHPIRSC